MPEPSHRAFARRHLVVMCAPNGARRMKADHPALPMTAAELADEAARLVAVGVSVLHLHVRNKAGQHSLSVDRYREALAAIRARVGDRLVLQVTSEAAGRYAPDEQMARMRALQPEAVSLALRELMPDPGSPDDALRFFGDLARGGSWIQYIVYSPAELEWLERVRAAGRLGAEHPACLLVLGRYAPARAGSKEELRAFLDTGLLEAFAWTACCFGPDEASVLRDVVSDGGHVRLGFENNLHRPGGQLARDNAELVRDFLDALPTEARKPTTAKEVRRHWKVGVTSTK